MYVCMYVWERIGAYVMGPSTAVAITSTYKTVCEYDGK